MPHNNIAPRTVTTPEAYAQAFEDAQPVTIPEASGLLGRIVRGKSADGFEHLAKDDRRLVFAMGGDGLAMLPGQPLRHALRIIGLTPSYVQGRIDQGYSFKLAVFGSERRETHATWDNVLHQVADCYPELEADISRHAPVLKDQVLPHDIEAIDLAGEAHADFISLERYQDIPQAERDINPLLLRRLLLHEVHLGTLFEGDGYTKTHDGERGMQEHVIPNSAIADLPNAVMIDLL